MAKSGIVDHLRSVKWDLLDTSLYYKKAEVAVFSVHAATFMWIIQDPRLYELATAVRAAIKHFFRNGQAKTLSSTIVHLANHYLCTDYNLSLNV